MEKEKKKKNKFHDNLYFATEKKGKFFASFRMIQKGKSKVKTYSISFNLGDIFCTKRSAYVTRLTSTKAPLSLQLKF